MDSDQRGHGGEPNGGDQRLLAIAIRRSHRDESLDFRAAA
jgi:hypothetical protein